jgi:ribosomal 50S subunit-associated protein YjgA (DUF615 family)
MTTEQMPTCSACGTILPTTVQAAEYRVISNNDLIGFLGSALAHAGWRVLATYSEPMLRQLSIAGVWRDTFVQEPRFIIGRSDRDELMETLKRSLREATDEKSKLKYEVERLQRAEKVLSDRLESTARAAADRMKEVEAVREELAQVREGHEQQDAAHHRLEADFGKVRAAIGDLALKKILDAAK